MAINLNIISKFDQKGLKRAQDALKSFATGAVKAAGAAVAGVGLIGVQSVRSFASFDAQMTKSLAIMGDVSDAMETDMANAAREVAKATTFSADQAAESFFFLASAGLDAEQAVAAMPQVAKFAQAGMFDMALATDLATDAQSALGLTSDDAAQNLENLTRVTDVFVKANTLANTSVQQISEALTNKAGAALRVVNKDVEEGAAVLALFADQGVKGAEAGEKLNVVLRDVPRAAARNADGFRELGLEVLDADGNLRNMADIVDEFTDVLGPMSDAQAAATLEQLGLTRSVGDAIKLLMGGGDSIREYEEALRSAGGTTEEVANNQLDTLSAKADLLRSRIADLGISIGTSLAPLADDLIEQLGPTIDGLEGPLIKLFEELAPKIAELIGKVPELIESLIPLIEPMGNISAAFIDLVDVTLPAFQVLLEELEPVIDGFTGFLAENGEVVGGLIVAFAIFRTILAVTSVALGVFAGASGVAAGASGGFFATLAKNPLGALIALVVGGATSLVVFGDEATKTGGKFSDFYLGVLKGADIFQRGLVGVLNSVIRYLNNTALSALNVLRVINGFRKAVDKDPILFEVPTIPLLEPGGGGIQQKILELEIAAGIRGGGAQPDHLTGLGRQLNRDELMSMTGPLLEAARANQAAIDELNLSQQQTQIPFLPGQGPTQQNNITINAGLGVNGNRLAEDVVGLLEQYDRQAGPVFERAG